MQTRSRHRAPQLSLGLIADIASAIAEFPALPPIECRLHPDDWDHLRAMLPPTAKGLAQVSLFATIDSPNALLTELRIILDIDAPRLSRKGGAPC